MAITINDATKNPLFIPTGEPLTFAKAVTVTDTNSRDATEIVTVILKPSGNDALTNTNLGTISDPNGGGTFFNDKDVGFTESGPIGSNPNFATGLLSRLVYNAPTLKNGQSAEVTATIAVADEIPPDTKTVTITNAPITIDVVTPPAISGTVANAPVPPGGTINPFATVTLVDNNFNQTAQDVASIIVTDGKTRTDADGLLAGAGLSKTGTGTYTLSNPDKPITIQDELRNLTFYPTATDGHTVSFELDVTNSKADLTSKDTKTSVLLPKEIIENRGPPNFWITYPGKEPIPSDGSKYVGPVVGITDELIILTSDNINVVAHIPNVFIHTGSGDDAIDVSKENGNNVLDGGTGSNFLRGGSGRDTFYVDDRNTSDDVFSTVAGFHAGDNVTIWTPPEFKIATLTQKDFEVPQKTTANGLRLITSNNQGAAGFKGLTFGVTSPQAHDANLTLTGYSRDDLTNGRLSISFGHTGDLPGLRGSDYMQIHANS